MLLTGAALNGLTYIRISIRCFVCFVFNPQNTENKKAGLKKIYPNHLKSKVNDELPQDQGLYLKSHLVSFKKKKSLSLGLFVCDMFNGSFKKRTYKWTIINLSTKTSGREVRNRFWKKTCYIRRAMGLARTTMVARVSHAVKSIQRFLGLLICNSC